MLNLISVLEYVKLYLVDLLAHTKELFDNHLEKMEVALEKQLQVGLRVNAEECIICMEMVEHIQYFLFI